MISELQGLTCWQCLLNSHPYMDIFALNLTKLHNVKQRYSFNRNTNQLELDILVALFLFIPLLLVISLSCYLRREMFEWPAMLLCDCQCSRVYKLQACLLHFS